MRALDLFCGAGGASMGLHRAGFDVTGVDINPQPEYPFKFIQAHVFDVDWSGYDFIWASPPCQAFTRYKRRAGHVRPRENMIPLVRSALMLTCTPFVIENVEDAPLINPVKLCGSMFGLDVQRHRIFESSFDIPSLDCRHDVWTPRFPPATNRTNLRKTVEVGVWRIPIKVQREAMGINWMSLKTLSQAIPPAYSEYIARQFLKSRMKTA